MPDLARLSQHSKAYLSAANAGITDGVRPILDGRWAAVAASATSVAVLLLPLFRDASSALRCEQAALGESMTRSESFCVSQIV